MHYPYEGDLLAVLTGVALPRLVEENLNYIGSLFGAPHLQVQLDEILDDAEWSRRMTQRE